MVNSQVLVQDWLRLEIEEPRITIVIIIIITKIIIINIIVIPDINYTKTKEGRSLCLNSNNWAEFPQFNWTRDRTWLWKTSFGFRSWFLRGGVILSWWRITVICTYGGCRIFYPVTIVSVISALDKFLKVIRGLEEVRDKIDKITFSLLYYDCTSKSA